MAELEALKKEREVKMSLIAKKKDQLEDLKRKKALSAGLAGSTGVEGASELLSEVLKGGVADQSTVQQFSFKTRSHFGVEKLVTNVVIAQQEQDVYSKYVQTEGSYIAADREREELDSRGPVEVSSGAMNMMTRLKKNQPRKASNAGLAERRGSGDKASGGGIMGNLRGLVDHLKAREMTAEEREKVLGNPDFLSFFDRTTKIVERCLGQSNWDLDFIGGAGGDGDADTGDSEKLQFVDHYVDDKWASGRPVTDCRFSPKREELFLGSYGKKFTPSLSDPDGCLLVWNLAMKNRPEFSFTCQSTVLTGHFNKFDPRLFFGGTYSGSVVLWDGRAKSGPVQRTPLSTKGHSHPIYAMQQVGTQNATNLISASSDGRLCVWSLAMLHSPQDYIDLKRGQSGSRDLAATSLSFPENETNVLYVGAEDGSVDQVHIHGSKVGITEEYTGHEGPVMSVDLHPHGEASQHGVDIADMMLSTSVDWSIKLWMVKQYQQPVLSIDAFEDYVYDAKWHPAHPSVFASVDGEGHLDLWNLNSDQEASVARCESAKKLALNHCGWSVNGRHIVTGDTEGNLGVYVVDRSIAQPRPDDFINFEEKVRTFQPIGDGKDPGALGLDGKGVPNFGKYGGGLGGFS